MHRCFSIILPKWLIIQSSLKITVCLKVLQCILYSKFEIMIFNNLVKYAVCRFICLSIVGYIHKSIPFKEASSDIHFKNGKTLLLVLELLDIFTYNVPMCCPGTCIHKSEHLLYHSLVIVQYWKSARHL